MRKYLIILMLFLTVLMIPFSNTEAMVPGMHTIVAKPDCNKCHPEVQPQLGVSHSSLGCSGCHQKNSVTHITKTIRCEDCHSIPQDIHMKSYPNCIDCHISHGQLRYDMHNNVTFMRTHTCTSCHNMHGTFSISSSPTTLLVVGGSTTTFTG